MQETLEKPMFRRAILALLAFAALGLGEASAQRYPRGPYDSQVVPLERVLPQIRRGYPGTFYDAEGPYPDAMGNPHYHIKWMTPEGRILWLDTDARTGHVLGVNGSGWRNQFRGQYPAPSPYGGGPYGAPPRYAPPQRAYPPPGWTRGGAQRNWNGGGNRWNGGGQPGPRGHHGH
jgi:hypothetical protein